VNNKTVAQVSLAIAWMHVINCN